MYDKIGPQGQEVVITDNTDPTTTSLQKTYTSTSNVTPNIQFDAGQVDVSQYISLSQIKILKNKDDDQVVCDVCLDDDDEDGDEIVVCEECLAAVHQKCYGGDLIGKVPSGSWYCARCRFMKRQKGVLSSEISCKFCTDLRGILKPTQFSI